jgi:hypothetical protein
MKHNPEPWDPLGTPEAAIYRDYVDTGLIKVCPRCGRYGTVAAKRSPDGTEFLVLWEGKARHPNPGGTHDLDLCVDIDLLMSTSFGCGYD